MMRQEDLEQFWYTSAPGGMLHAPGFQVVAATPGITEATVSQVQQHLDYQPPPDADPRPTPEAIRRDFPVSYRAVPLDGGALLIVRSAYVGQEYKPHGQEGRWGNFLAHAVIVPAEHFDGHPAKLWRAIDWKTALTAEEVAALDEKGTITLGAPTLSLPAPRSASVDALHLGFAALCFTRALDRERQVILSRQGVADVLTAMETTQAILPVEITRRFSWSTFETGDERGYDAIARETLPSEGSSGPFAVVGRTGAGAYRERFFGGETLPDAAYWEQFSALDGFDSQEALDRAANVVDAVAGRSGADGPGALDYLATLSHDTHREDFAKTVAERLVALPAGADIVGTVALMARLRRWAGRSLIDEDAFAETLNEALILPACVEGGDPERAATAFEAIRAGDGNIHARLLAIFRADLDSIIEPDTASDEQRMRMARLAHALRMEDPAFEALKARMLEAALDDAAAAPVAATMRQLGAMEGVGVARGTIVQQVCAHGDHLSDSFFDAFAGFATGGLKMDAKRMSLIANGDTDTRLTRAILTRMVREDAVDPRILGDWLKGLVKSGNNAFGPDHAIALVDRLVQDEPAKAAAYIDLVPPSLAHEITRSGTAIPPGLARTLDAALAGASEDGATAIAKRMVGLHLDRGEHETPNLQLLVLSEQVNGGSRMGKTHPAPRDMQRMTRNADGALRDRYMPRIVRHDLDALVGDGLLDRIDAWLKVDPSVTDGPAIHDRLVAAIAAGLRSYPNQVEKIEGTLAPLLGTEKQRLAKGRIVPLLEAAVLDVAGQSRKRHFMHLGKILKGIKDDTYRSILLGKLFEVSTGNRFTRTFGGIGRSAAAAVGRLRALLPKRRSR